LATQNDTPDVELVSAEELIESARRTVESTGFTIVQLEDQAFRGEFANERARLAWGLVGDIRRAFGDDALV